MSGYAISFFKYQLAGNVTVGWASAFPIGTAIINKKERTRRIPTTFMVFVAPCFILPPNALLP
jgi:hypothetical protein